MYRDDREINYGVNITYKIDNLQNHKFEKNISNLLNLQMQVFPKPLLFKIYKTIYDNI